MDYRIAGLRLSLAFVALGILEIKAGFRQDQPRGDKGRWSGGGGSIIVTQKDKTGDPRIDAKTDQILDVLKEVIESNDPGQGPLYDIEIHTKAAARMRELDLPGIGKHGVEQSFSAGDTVRYGFDGSVRTDFIYRNGRTSAAPIRAIWDLKTGRARLTPKRVRELRDAVGVDDSVPVIELHIDRGITVKNHIFYNFLIGVARA
ncbi:hypothetical protein [Methylobacterium sp. J-077]|uniref:hypothetical protein n=1 Tax=Methylobacterium sp. J-077 TaxID=2836656 RepID=UPI001FBB8D16|nr:hypothetical protein [Methylobacterium sp. J-077]MCJ2125799.1 hypothetical protein [Methylobacterium sp. J-077]